ncbi:MAG: ParB/RepB/Spo0J family partition protein [Candidatus Brennerbacteria bacterium]
MPHERSVAMMTREVIEKNRGNGQNGKEKIMSMKDILSLMLKFRGQQLVLDIPIRLIRKFPDQPRKKFKPESLVGLAASIKKIGQRKIGAVRLLPEKDGFELIDGERRYRACVLAGKETYRAVVEHVESTAEQFRMSLVMNFLDERHTPLEIASALDRMMTDYLKEGKTEKDAIQEIIGVLGKSVTWVRQNLGLLKLCPEVRELVEEKEIPFQVGVALTNRTPEFQIKMARKILDRGFDHKRALAFIRAHEVESSFVPGGRRRTSNDDYRLLNRFLRQLQQNAENVLGMKYEKFEGMFRNRPLNELMETIRSIGDRVDELKQLQETLIEIRNERITPRVVSTSAR